MSSLQFLAPCYLKLAYGQQEESERTGFVALGRSSPRQAADGAFVKWLMEHQREAGVFTTVSGLVEQLTDNPAARLTAQEIAERVQKAQQQRTGAQATPAA